MSNIFKTNKRIECLIDGNRRDNQSKNRFNNLKKKNVYEFNNVNFPSLSNNVDMQHIPDGISYMDKINSAPKITDDEMVDQLDYGWCSIELDKSNNKPIFTTNIITQDEPPTNYELVIDNLNSKYVTFMENYIELWGEEEAEHMFVFPNHDYDYFDKLEYEEEEFAKELYKRDNYNYQIETYADMHYN